MDLTTAALDSGSPVRTHGTGASEGCAPHRVVHVEVDEDFGRPSLVSIDIVAASSGALLGHGAATRVLDATIRAAWNNPGMAPVGVHVRVPLVYDEADDPEASGVQTDMAVDMSALGFADKIMHPDKSYGRYDAPECGPAWGP